MSDALTITDQEREACKALNELADELDDHQKKLDASKLSFSTTGAAAGIMTIAGLALSPFTAGASLGLVIAGGVVGGLSAAGGMGSMIVDKILTSKTLKKAQGTLHVLAEKIESVERRLPELLATLNKKEKQMLISKLKKNEIVIEVMNLFEKSLGELGSELKQNTQKVLEITDEASLASFRVKQMYNLAKVLHKWTKVQKALQALGKGARVAAKTANAGRAVGTAAEAGIDTAKTAGKTLSGLKIAGIATAGVGLVVDLGGIVYYSMKVHKKKPCEVAENIRGVAKCLE